MMVMVGKIKNTFPSTMLWSNKAYTYFCVFGFKIVYTDKQYPIILDSAMLFSQPFLHFLCVPLSVGAKSFRMSIPLLLQLRDPQPKAAQLSPGIAIYDLLSCKTLVFSLFFFFHFLPEQANFHSGFNHASI